MAISSKSSVDAEVSDSWVRLFVFYVTPLIAISTTVGLLFGERLGLLIEKPLTRSSILLSARELGERFVFGLWLLIALFVVILVLKSAKSGPSPEIRRFQNAPTVGETIGLSITIAVVLSSVLFSTDRLNLWVGLPVVALAASLLLSVAYLTTGSYRNFFRAVSLLCLASLLVFQVLLMFFQTPNYFRDPFHFAYFSEDLLFLSAGRQVLIDFVPQYSTFLGWPLKALLEIANIDPVIAVIFYVSSLQLASLLLALMIVGRRLPWSVRLIQTVTFVSLLSFTTTANTNSSSYFAVFPLRTLGPTLLIAVLVLMSPWALRRKVNGLVLAFVLGCIATAVAINNPDFGTAAAVSVLVLIVALPWRETHRAIIFAMFASGSFLGFSALTFPIWAQQPRALEFLFFFQRWSGTQGFVNEPMSAFGLHIPVVALFVIAIGLGSAQLTKVSISSNEHSVSSALGILGPALWGLLSMPYFIGRSEQTTLIGGLSFVVGWSICSLIPGALNFFARQRQAAVKWWMLAYAALPFILLSALPIAAGLNGVTRELGVTERFSAREALSTHYELMKAVNDLVDARGVAVTDVTNLLPMASSVALETGTKSNLVVNHPSYLGIEGRLALLQCNELTAISSRYVVLLEPTLESLASTRECANVFGRVVAQQPLSTGDKLIMSELHN